MVILPLLLCTSCVHALQLSSSGSPAESDPVPSGDNWEWEENPNPSWLMPEMTGAPPKGAKIAITFRGEYLRNSRSFMPDACSDYWMNKENIDEFIVAPLKKAGAQVKLYFHTYSYCSETDRDLIADFKPAKFKIDGPLADFSTHGLGQVYSMFEAMRVVVEDAWADYFVMLRFDESFHAKITSLNVKWDSLNIGWRGEDDLFTTFRKVCDLFFAMPVEYVDYFSAALKVTAHRKPELGLPEERFWQSEDLMNSTLSANTSVETEEEVPHMVYDPLVKLIGVSNINFLDEQSHRSGRNEGFVYINRQCGSHVSKC